MSSWSLGHIFIIDWWTSEFHLQRNLWSEIFFPFPPFFFLPLPLNYFVSNLESFSAGDFTYKFCTALKPFLRCIFHDFLILKTPSLLHTKSWAQATTPSGIPIKHKIVTFQKTAHVFKWSGKQKENLKHFFQHKIKSIYNNYQKVTRYGLMIATVGDI